MNEKGRSTAKETVRATVYVPGDRPVVYSTQSADKAPFHQGTIVARITPLPAQCRLFIEHGGGRSTEYFGVPFKLERGI